MPRSSVFHNISCFFRGLVHITLHTAVIAEALVLVDLGNTLRLVQEIFLIQLKTATFPVYKMPLRDLRLNRTESLGDHPYTVAVKQTSPYFKTGALRLPCSVEEIMNGKDNRRRLFSFSVHVVYPNRSFWHLSYSLPNGILSFIKSHIIFVPYLRSLIYHH